MKGWRAVIALLALAVAVPAAAMTRSELRDEVRRGIRDTATDTDLRRYSDTTLNAYLEEAQRALVNDTWCLEGYTSGSLSANTTYYTSVSTAAIAIKLVRFTAHTTNNVRLLKERSKKSVYEQNPDWAKTAGAPNEYFATYSESGATNIVLGMVPPPATASTGTIHVTWVAQADPFGSDASEALNGMTKLKPYHWALVYHVIEKIDRIDGFSAEADKYAALYTSAVEVMKARFGDMPNYNPGAVGGSR